MELICLIFAYILGSFPSGYLISKITSGENILNVGWRKTSGSNVFKNIGKKEGIIVGILDISKGFLAVWIAQYLGFSSLIQVLSGFFAVAGHNWSLFLKFSGGRGVGTFLGALLLLSPKILLIVLIPSLLIALIWNASIGTLFCFVFSILISFYFNQFQTVGIFSILVFLIILLKRLSPISEIISLKNKKEVIKNRLLFDDDIPRYDLRILRILRRLKKRGQKLD